MTKSRKLTRSRRYTNKSKGQKSKGRSGKRKSKKPRVSRRAHSLRGGSQVKAINEENRNTIHSEHSTHQHKTPPTVDKESKWTKTGRALMYGVGAAGTGAITANLLAAPLLADTLYDEKDLDEGGRLYQLWRNELSGKNLSEQELILEKQRFLQLQNILHYTKEHWKQNAVIGAGLAAAAAGTYGATRHKKDAKATKPGKLTRAGRALMYGVGAVGTGAAIGATALKTVPKYYTLVDLQTGGSLKKEWDEEKLLQKQIQDFNLENPHNIINANFLTEQTAQTFLNHKNMIEDQNNTNNRGRNAMIGAGLAAVAAGTYGATRD